MFYDVTKYGAIGDGKTNNTVAITAAISACARKGGGTVFFPSGTFLTGSIELQDNITLYLDNGCTLLASGDPKDFPTNGFIHNEMGKTTSLLWARGKRNIVICGGGTIDINSSAYYDEATRRSYGGLDPAALNESQLKDFIYSKNNARINQPLFFESCQNIRISDVRIVNSTCWTVVFSRSSYILVRGIVIDNDLNVQNDDGIHLSACSDAVISDCMFSCADDCIALTCITAHGLKNQRVNISNCVMRSRSAAVRIGHSAEDVVITNLNIYNNNRGIGIFAASNCRIANVLISNVTMHNQTFASGWWGKGEALLLYASEDGGAIEDVTITNVIAEAESGIILFGSDHNIRNISVSNCTIRLTHSINSALVGNCIDIRPYYFCDDTGGKLIALYVKDTCNVKFSNVSIIHSGELEYFYNNIGFVNT